MLRTRPHPHPFQTKVTEGRGDDQVVIQLHTVEMKPVEATEPEGGVKGKEKLFQKEKTTKLPKRIGRSMYVATANDGKFGIIDTHEVTNGQAILLVHIPKKENQTVLDIRVGDVIRVKQIPKGSNEYPVQVRFVGRSQYFRPGTRISSCIIGVPCDEWKNV